MKVSTIEVQDIFLLEERICQHLRKPDSLTRPNTKRIQLLFEVTALPVENTIRQRVAITSPNFSPDPTEKFRQVLNRSTCDKIELVFHLIRPAVTNNYVFQIQLFGNILHHTDFFSNRINQRKLGLGLAHRYDQARTRASGSNVHDTCP